MARVRDYKAEYARRKARLAANPEAKRAYYKRQYQRDVERAIRRGQPSVRADKRSQRLLKSNRWRQAENFSNKFALTEKALFLPDRADRLGLTAEQYLKAYEQAWYDYDDNRRTGTDGLRDWFAINHFYDYTLNHYDERYTG